jgi:hypothetical protein
MRSDITSSEGSLASEGTSAEVNSDKADLGSTQSKGGSTSETFLPAGSVTPETTIARVPSSVEAGAIRELDAIRDRARAVKARVLLDPISLLILKTIVEKEGLSISSMDDIVANAKGWSHVIRLVQAQLVDLRGDFIQPTSLGETAFAEIATLLKLNAS